MHSRRPPPIPHPRPLRPQMRFHKKKCSRTASCTLVSARCSPHPRGKHQTRPSRHLQGHVRTAGNSAEAPAGTSSCVRWMTSPHS
jgi:hypothetical protein